MGCESQIAVDSVEEKEAPELNYSILNQDKSILEPRGNLEPGPVTDFTRSAEAEEMLGKHGIDPNQKPDSKSLQLEWKVGEEAFNSMFEAGIMDCPGGPEPKSTDDGFTILNDCICPPNCGGGGGSPDPGDPIQISSGSKVTVLGHLNAVKMESWSYASEPIYYIDVVGSSYRNSGLLTDLWDGGYNQSSAAVALTAFKQNLNPEHFYQGGEHWFSETGDSGTLVLWTSDSTSF